MIRSFAAALALSVAALSAAAQTTPATNYTDMWWNAGESGWGVSFMQHATSNQVFAVWYTYDPRETSNGQFKPLWIVMSGGTWTSPTTITGPVYVTNGVPYNQLGGKTAQTQVGTFTFSFSSASTGTFAYNIAGSGTGTDPGAGLPAFSGTKSITRQSF